PLEQSALGFELMPGQATGVAAEAVTCDDSVAGNDDRNRVEAHDPADGTGRNSGAAGFGEFAVGDGGPGLDGLGQSREHRFGDVRDRSEGDREVEVAEAAVEVGAQLSDRLDEDGIHAAVRRLTPIEIASAGRVIAVGFATGRVGGGGAPFEPDDAPSVAAHGDGA